MIVELVEKLLDRLIQLLKHRQDVNRNVFDDFIEPVFAQFESVHNGYLASFKEYKTIVKKAANFRRMVASLAVKVKEDNLFTAAERKKLQSLANWDKYGSSAEEGLAQNIISYLVETKADLVEDISQSQTWRNSLLQELRGGVALKEHEDSPDHKKKEVLSNIIDDIVEQMQSEYGEVVDQYNELRRRYLDERVGRRKRPRPGAMKAAKAPVN